VAGSGHPEEGKRFFFEKKKQKTFGAIALFRQCAS